MGNNYSNNYSRSGMTSPCSCHNHNQPSQTCHQEHGHHFSDFPIGMGYVPWQTWRNIYEPDKALMQGTIFAELDKPFLGARMRGGRK